ncbi:MAG TPA: hypothetical protein VIH71_03950 [Solirubrobacteraceae bacterium]
MTPTLSPTPTNQRRAARSDFATPPRHQHRRTHKQVRRGQDQRLLGHYTDRSGNRREVVARPGAAGSMLVLDRDRTTLEDLRVVAHLAADEPVENAAVVCAAYLCDATTGRHRCRLLNDEDLCCTPFADQSDTHSQTAVPSAAETVDHLGSRYRLQRIETGMSIPELRWWRTAEDIATPAGEPVSIREVIAATESYEPVRALTAQALSLHDGVEISTAVLRCELARVQQSPIVLNRRLREVVLAVVAREELSMSEIAVRCGRIKRDRKGNESGETSWLARRIGMLPEGGRHAPTPWIHTDVLALIARDGLGISPREVEL